MSSTPRTLSAAKARKRPPSSGLDSDAELPAHLGLARASAAAIHVAKWDHRGRGRRKGLAGADVAQRRALPAPRRAASASAGRLLSLRGGTASRGVPPAFASNSVNTTSRGGR